ncbi:MAG: hypothetical protein SNJ84_06820 [Verrucomicrobiia bacterium]
MSETLCDWSKHDIKNRATELAELLRHPAFFCRKCARAASTPHVLCKPTPLPPPQTPPPTTFKP